MNASEQQRCSVAATSYESNTALATEQQQRRMRATKQHRQRCMRCARSRPLIYSRSSLPVLATIEGIYYLYREHWEATQDEPYAGAYDTLLYFYKYVSVSMSVRFIVLYFASCSPLLLFLVDFCIR